MKKVLIFIFVMVLNFQYTFAQCPMCRASAESSDYANGLNKGIIYLLFLPFILVISVGIFWYFNREKFKVNS